MVSSVDTTPPRKKPPGEKNRRSGFKARVSEYWFGYNKEGNCLFAGTPYPEAAHICPHAYKEIFDVIWGDKFGTEPPGPPGIDTFQNGLMINPWLHQYLDMKSMPRLTVRKADSKYIKLCLIDANGIIKDDMKDLFEMTESNVAAHEFFESMGKKKIKCTNDITHRIIEVRNEMIIRGHI
jgi:hypothetical protein